MNYKRGDMVGFTSGEYSDFRFNGLVVFLQDVDLQKLAQQFYAEEKERLIEESKKENYDWVDKPDPIDLIGWLVAKGFAVPVEYSEKHLGTYYEFDPDFGVNE